METEALFQKLEQAFEETFVEELIPGILHNFANPLNGIMGRAQILQRRLNDTIKKIEDQYPETAAAFSEPHKKLVSDVVSICQESDRFFNMFQDVSGKFYAIGSAAPERINLSDLLAAELRFADYYLDFKHELTKELDLKEGLPEIHGIPTYYSLCFWSLFRNAITRMKGASEKTLFISTSEEDACVVVRMRYAGPPLDDADQEMIDRVGFDDDPEIADADLEVSSLYLSLYLLRRLGARVDLREQGGYHEIEIRVPY